MAPADYRRWKRILVWSILTGSTVWLLSLVSFWKPENSPLCTVLLDFKNPRNFEGISEAVPLCGIVYFKIVRPPGCMIAMSPFNQP